MIRHKYLLPVILVFAVLLISGCSTPPGKIVYDPGFPPEKTTVVVFEEPIQSQSIQWDRCS
ncbi:MAG: hypothetical protein FWG29_02950 [Treponema sp.]|nr:hypothetical protein [Treponema sp.]